MHNLAPVRRAMKLLIITQKMDCEDPVLGFFHHWVEKLAAALRENNRHLPAERDGQPAPGYCGLVPG